MLPNKKTCFEAILPSWLVTKALTTGLLGHGRVMAMVTKMKIMGTKSVVELANSPRRLWISSESWLKQAWTCAHSTCWFPSILLIGIFRDILYQDPIGTYNPVPLSNLTESVPQIHFPTYFSTFTSRAYSGRVIMTYPAYSISLSNILNETSSEVIEAYLVSRAALTLSPYLGTSTEAWQAQRSLEELLTGIKKGAVGDRAEYCVGIVEENLGFAVGRYFVNETFRDQAKEKGTKVITGINKLLLTSYYLLIPPHKTLLELSNLPLKILTGWTRNLPRQLPKKCQIFYASIRLLIIKNRLMQSASKLDTQFHPIPKILVQLQDITILSRSLRTTFLAMYWARRWCPFFEVFYFRCLTVWNVDRVIPLNGGQNLTDGVILTHGKCFPRQWMLTLTRRQTRFATFLT